MEIEVTSAQTSAATELVHVTKSNPSSRVDEGRFAPGTLLAGRYRIIGLLGVGGMGEVYRATDLTLGQSVALKFLPETATVNETLIERFHSEVRVARQVSHANVCRVYDIGQAEGMPFISMEYVDGEDLASLLHRIGRLPSERAMGVARKICAGVAAAHGKGVIHRDLKPQNIMMDKRGEIVIMDFGLAAIADQLSGREARNGTPAYMAPEQLKGSEVTAKSDIYAVGLVLYELFTGRRAYEGNTLQKLLEQQESGHLTSMSSIATDIDPAVEKVIRRCLNADPAKRPVGALSISAALPGGDPLAAALAAGETPSPELVAAGRTQGLALRYSLICVAIVLVCIAGAGALKQRKDAFYQTQLDYPPDVLGQKSREIAASFGYSARPKDSVWWLNQRLDLVQYLDLKSGSKDWGAWLNSEAPVSVIYRESQEPMVAQPTGRITDTEPPISQPGMITMEVDGAGRLRGFAAMPTGKASGTVEAATVFKAAGLDVNNFHKVEPHTIPGTTADEVLAWSGPHPVIPNTELTLEIGWWKGQITQAKFTWPWMVARKGQPINPGITFVQNSILPFLAGGGILFALFLARRNWIQGRGDRLGSFRIAIAQFCIGMVVWIGMVHLTPGNNVLSLLLTEISHNLFSAVILGLLYLALEPAVRSRWPHSIVTWTRLLEGRWKDPQVGAHVLIGAAAGVLLFIAAELHGVLVAPVQGLDTAGGVFLLNGTRQWIAGMASRSSEALNTGMVVFFVIFGLRTVLRKDWIAAVLAAMVFSAGSSDLMNSVNWQMTFTIMGILYAALIFILLRFGLLTTIAAIFFLNALNGITLASDWSTWYAPTGIATMLFMLGIAGLAFKFSLGSGKLQTD